MKKIVFCLGLAFLLFSCGRRDWEDTVVANRSDREVSFRFHHTGTFTLAPDDYVAFPSESFQGLAWFTYEGHDCARCPENPVYPYNHVDCFMRVRFLFGVTGDGAVVREFRSRCGCERREYVVCDGCACVCGDIRCDNLCDCGNGA